MRAPMSLCTRVRRLRISPMDQAKKRREADIAAELNHFRTEAFKQELETGEIRSLRTDAVTAVLPSTMQVTRPAFPMDDVPSNEDS